MYSNKIFSTLFLFFVLTITGFAQVPPPPGTPNHTGIAIDEFTAAGNHVPHEIGPWTLQQGSEFSVTFDRPTPCPDERTKISVYHWHDVNQNGIPDWQSGEVTTMVSGALVEITPGDPRARSPMFGVPNNATPPHHYLIVQIRTFCGEEVQPWDYYFTEFFIAIL